MNEKASALSLVGAGCFGMIIGWFVYYINRHRTDAVRFHDIAGLIGAVGGGAVLALFPAGSEMFGAYGIGLFVGFFGYFVVLARLISRSDNFDRDYLIDGRRKDVAPGQQIPDHSGQGAMHAGQDLALRE